MKEAPYCARLKTLVRLAAALWTAGMLGLGAWAGHEQAEETLRVAELNAREDVAKELAFIDWVVGTEGLYVPSAAKRSADASRKPAMIDHFSSHKDRLRMWNQESDQNCFIRLSSLSPKSSAGVPDAWERKSLEAFARGLSEAVAVEGGALRFMRPLKAEAPCLRCHEGYRLGDIVGGISSAMRLEPLAAAGRQERLRLGLSLLLIWVVGILALGLASRNLGALASQRESVIADLEEALAQVKTLSGFIPICASCKKIRDDKGFWDSVEKYITQRSNARFSHGMCPDCGKKLYGELWEEEFGGGQGPGP